MGPIATSTSPAYLGISFINIQKRSSESVNVRVGYVVGSNVVTLFIIPSIITAIIGPTEHSAISPKLSFSASLSARIEETPTPSAIINGTVIGPVVTPPESKESAKKLFGTKNASRNTIA